MKESRRSTPHAVVSVTSQLRLEIVQRVDQLAKELGITRHRVICQAIAAGLPSVAATRGIDHGGDL